LNDEEEYTLTHRGKALAEGQEEGDDYGDDDDMSVDSVDEEREKDQSSLGFGGLHLKRAPQQQNGEDDDDMSSIEVPDDDDYDSDLEDGNLRKKSKREIMAELIGKSKRFKVRANDALVARRKLANCFALSSTKNNGKEKNVWKRRTCLTTNFLKFWIF
jgi:hypothetical protein